MMSKLSWYLAVFVALLAGANGWLAVVRFGVLATPNSISEIPKESRRWTTFYNYYTSLLIYVSISTVVFVILIYLRDLTAILADILPNSPLTNELKSAVEKSRGTYPWVDPVLALVVLLGLFHFSKSPLALIDKALRNGLQRVASIPRKVRVLLHQLKTASFVVPEACTKPLILRASTVLKTPLTLCLVKKADPILWAYTEATYLDLILEEWSKSKSAHHDLYASASDWIQKLHSRFCNVSAGLDILLFLQKSQMSAPDVLNVSKERHDVADSLDSLIHDQRVQLACAIVKWLSQ